MLSRRTFCQCALSLPLLATAARAEPTGCGAFTPERQADITPNEAIALLEAGNRRFLEGRPLNCDPLAQVRETAHGQFPYAAILGCIDSRVPPEIVFDQRIGDVFSARVAGNVVSDDIVGSLEYSTEVAGAKAIVVLGHRSCGAVMGAIDGVRLGSITGLVEKIEPAIAVVDAPDGEIDSDDHRLVQKVAEANARIHAARLTERSAVLDTLVKAGELKIVAAMHDVTTGAVSWLS